MARRAREAEVEVKRGWMPTHKWILAQIVGLAGIATSWIDSGWDDTESKLLIALAVQAAATYLLPNDLAPGGVADTKVAVHPVPRRPGEAGYGVVELVIVVLVILILVFVLLRVM